MRRLDHAPALALLLAALQLGVGCTFHRATPAPQPQSSPETVMAAREPAPEAERDTGAATS
ncbi:MAG: efflux RND transporter periplasmic adaptor subunit, partial [Myxococcota bacterium]